MIGVKRELLLTEIQQLKERCQRSPSTLWITERYLRVELILSVESL